MSEGFAYVNLLLERDTLKKRLIKELMGQFFWFYQIDDRAEPFGNSFPTVEQVVTRFHSFSFPEGFYDHYYYPMSFAVEYTVLTDSTDKDKPGTIVVGEWYWPYISTTIEGKIHSINGWRKAKHETPTSHG